MMGVGRLLPLAAGLATLATPDAVVVGVAVLLLVVNLSSSPIGSAVVLRVIFAALQVRRILYRACSGYGVKRR